MHNAPYQNVNGSLVNVDGSNYNGSAFTSTVLPQTVNPNVLPQPLSNVQAAASYIPGMKGGGGDRHAKRKQRGQPKKKSFYNVSRHKHMTKRTISSKFKRTNRRSRSMRKRGGFKVRRTLSRTKRRRMRGGYGQYMNNAPYTASYSLGGNLSANNSALASPPPHQLNTLGENIDNYNHFTNMGFPSRNI